jgi:hypothetical protein
VDAVCGVVIHTFILPPSTDPVKEIGEALYAVVGHDQPFPYAGIPHRGIKAQDATWRFCRDVRLHHYPPFRGVAGGSGQIE